MCVFVTTRMQGHRSKRDGLLHAYARVCVCGGEAHLCVGVGRRGGCECVSVGRTISECSCQSTRFPKSKTITNLGAHFYLGQAACSSRGAASVGQDLRFLSLRPPERLSRSEHTAQTPQIKSHQHREGPRQEGVENPKGRYKGSHPLERKWRASSSPQPRFPA